MARSAVIAGVLLIAASTVDAQNASPQISKVQREALRQVVAAVDAASAEPETADASWQIHTLRASDGSHYVAVSVAPPSKRPAPSNATVLYVRLATATLVGRGVERSAVAEWLAGRRNEPLPRPGTGIAVGEMPSFGAGGLMDPNRPGRVVANPSGSNDLKLMQLERERAREEREAREKKRRAELEGAEQAKRDLMPFEDFDLTATGVAGSLQRAFTAGPGTYELTLAWMDAAGSSSSPVHLVKRTLQLPPANASELTVSSIILADQVTTRNAPYPPVQQAAHPYAIGLMELTPARDTSFSRDERLNVAFQVINARPSEIGKPDVGVTFRIVRLDGDRELPIASLTPQEYTAETLPPEFDLRVGHPIFPAMSVPLTTLARGNYRLKVAVNDRIAGRGTASDADFTVVGTPASLLAEAPSLGAPFRREMAVEPGVIDTVVRRLRSGKPSAALGRALDTLQQRKFVELIREEPVDPSESATRALITAIALFSLGDGSPAVQFQRSLQTSADPGPGLFFLGAARAIEGREVEAIAAWRSALDRGMPPAIVTPHLVNAYLRRGDVASATALPRLSSTSWSREEAALQIASSREADAIPSLERRLAAEPNDRDAEWLLIHALYASHVRQPDAATSDKFVQAARAYITAQRAHTPLVQEWVKVVTPSP